MLTDQVYSVELIPDLAQSAAARLERLGYKQVQVKQGDGYRGWPEFAPFDAIVVTAAAPEIPAALIEQLKDGGRLVIPVGPTFGPQYLMRLTRRGQTLQEEIITSVAFVPLVKPKQSQ
jgi:protein-L-isoaspartate(D-aspartate) O-methyltransferase